MPLRSTTLEELLEQNRGHQLPGPATRPRLVLVKTSTWTTSATPSRVPTTPEEISATIQHLVSEEASAINGARIPLYGNG